MISEWNRRTFIKNYFKVTYFRYLENSESSRACKIFQVMLREIVNAEIELCDFRVLFFFFSKRTQGWLMPYFQCHLPVINLLFFYYYYFNSTPSSIHASASFLVTLLLVTPFGSAVNLHLPPCCLALNLDTVALPVLKLTLARAERLSLLSLADPLIALNITNTHPTTKHRNM